MKYVILLIFFMASILCEAQTIDTLCLNVAETLEDAINTKNCKLTLGISDWNCSSNTFIISKKLESCTNLYSLSISAHRLLCIKANFDKFNYLEEISLDGYYNQYSLNKSIAKCKSLLYSTINIPDSNFRVPVFAYHLPIQTTILLNFNYDTLSFKKLKYELRHYLIQTNNKRISINARKGLFLKLETMSEQEKDCYQEVVKIANKNKINVDFFGLDIKD